MSPIPPCFQKWTVFGEIAEGPEKVHTITTTNTCIVTYLLCPSSECQLTRGTNFDEYLIRPSLWFGTGDKMDLFVLVVCTSDLVGLDRGNT